MKQKVNIEINRASVYESVRKQAAYIGKKSMVDGIDFEQVRLKLEHDELLDEYWNDALSGILSAVKHYVSYSNDDGNVLVIELQMPMNWDDVMKVSLERDMMQYFITYILWKWLMIAHTNGEMINIFATETNNLLGSVSRILFARRCRKRENKCCDLLGDCEYENEEGK